MSGKLFAFQLSRPAESTEPMSREYDPQTQIMVWQGGNSVRASAKVDCTALVEAGEAICVTSFPAYCKTSGQVCPPIGYACDGLD